MNTEKLTKLNNSLAENYSNYIKHVDTEYTLDEAKFSHLVGMLLSEIEGNKKNMQDSDITYADFAKRNVLRLTNYLIWITFLNAYGHYTGDVRIITIPRDMAEELFIHLLSYDAGGLYVV